MSTTITATTTPAQEPIVRLVFDENADATVHDPDWRENVLHGADKTALVMAAERLVQEGLLCGEERSGKLHIRVDTRTLRWLADVWFAGTRISHDRAKKSVDLLEEMIEFFWETAPATDFSEAEIALYVADKLLGGSLENYREALNFAESGIQSAAAAAIDFLAMEMFVRLALNRLPAKISARDAERRIDQAKKAGGLEGLHQLLSLRAGVKKVIWSPWNPAKRAAKKREVHKVAACG